MNAQAFIDRALFSVGAKTETLPAAVNMLELLNQAGEHLVSMSDWGWKKKIANVYARVGNRYVELPKDFEKLIQLETENELNSTVEQSSVENIQHAYNANIATTEFLWLWDVVGGGDNTPYQLYIYPEPATQQTWNLAYFRGWVELESTEDEVDIPKYCTGLLHLIMERVVRGVLESDVADVDQRLAGIIGGPTWTTAWGRDQTVTEIVGVTPGGEPGMGVGGPYATFGYRLLEDPS